MKNEDIRNFSSWLRGKAAGIEYMSDAYLYVLGLSEGIDMTLDAQEEKGYFKKHEEPKDG